MFIDKYWKKAAKRLDSLVSEDAKDFLYRNTGLFPPMPPKAEPLGKITAQIREQINQLRTVCVFLGPNRNLSTLTASVLALHPNCQVMSHGGPRVLPAVPLNFLDHYTGQKFVDFCHFALVMSQTQEKGGFGGSITTTHPFRNNKVIRQTFRKRFGRAMIKDYVQCLVWKEAHRVDDFVNEKNIDLSRIMKLNDKLRFILPVRNPLHVAYSFLSNSGFRQKYYKDVPEDDVKPILDDILMKMYRAVELQKRQPGRVFIFFEDEISEDLFVKLAGFLDISAEARWLSDAVRCFKVNETRYRIPPEINSYYASKVTTLFSGDPIFLAQFGQYLSKQGNSSFSYGQRSR